MNYIEEMNSFYDWLETNSVSDSAIVLWHALMHINSKTGWKPEFAVAISTLSAKTGLKKDAIGTARNRLQQAGRIRFTSRSGQQSAIYTIIPFASEIQTLTPPQIDSVGLTAANTATNRAQTPSQSAHKQPPLDISIDLSSKDLKTDRDILAQAVIDFKLQGVGAFGLDVIYSYLDVVETEVIMLAIKKAEKKSLGYFQTTLNNWISEGKTTVAMINPIPEKGEYRGKPAGGRPGGARRPEMAVVTNESEEQPMSEEDRQRALETIRRLKEPVIKTEAQMRDPF